MIIPPSGKAKHTKKTRSIRVYEHLLDKVDSIASDTGESANYIIEKLLEYALQQYDAEKMPAK